MSVIIINKAFENGVNEMMKEYGKQVTEVLSKVYGFNVEEALKHIESLQAFTIKKEEKTKAPRKKEVEKKALTVVEPASDSEVPKKIVKKTKKVETVADAVNAVSSDAVVNAVSVAEAVLEVPKKTVKKTKKVVEKAEAEAIVAPADAVPAPKKTVKKTTKMVIDSTPKKEETVILFPILDDEDEDDIYIQKINDKNHCINEKTGSIYEYKSENDGHRGGFIGVYKNGEAVFNK